MTRRLRRLASVLLVAGMAAATTVVPLSVEDLARASGLIVHARALDSWTAWDERGAMLYTYTRFRAGHALKGSLPEMLVVMQPGGSDGRYTQRVSGVRHWGAGDEVVLFLQPSRAQEGVFVVTGLMQGNFRVQRVTESEATVSNGAPDVAAFDRTTRKTSAYRGARMTLDALESRVRQAVRQE